MKKIIISLFILLLPAITFGASATLTPDTISSASTLISITCDITDTEIINIYDPNLVRQAVLFPANCGTEDTAESFMGLPLTVGNWVAVYAPDDSTNFGNCESYSACLLEAGAVDLGTIITVNAETSTGITSIITSANDNFSNTVGVSVSEMTEWSGSNFALVFLGGGMATLYALRFWIVGLVILLAVVYFSYRFFVFFKH